MLLCAVTGWFGFSVLWPEAEAALWSARARYRQRGGRKMLREHIPGVACVRENTTSRDLLFLVVLALFHSAEGPNLTLLQCTDPSDTGFRQDSERI